MGNNNNNESKGILYIKDRPIVLTQKELRIKPKAKENIIFDKSLLLNNINNTPGIYPQRAVPTFIIGLYGAVGKTSAQRKSPTKAATKPNPGPNIYPETNPIVAIKEICKMLLAGIVNALATKHKADKIAV